MIFQRALRRELTATAGAVFTTLFTITITIMLIRILGQAAGGQVSSTDVVALIGFAALNYLPVILILTGFIAVLLVITRSYQDSEMVVWFASGYSLTRWIRPVLTFGAPLIALITALSFVVTPWASRQSAEYRERFEKREDISKISPGKFQESASADRVFFVEGLSTDSTKVKNVFVSTVQNGRASLIVAREGAVQLNQRGDKFLVMSQGRRYDGVPGQSEFQLMEFERYGVLVSTQSQALNSDKSARALPTMALLRDLSPSNSGELLWRCALPIMGVLVLLLAIPLGFVNTRSGRSANLLIALLLFVVYSNLVNLTQAMVVQQKMALMFAWWPVHLLALALVAFFFSWRLKMNSRYHPLVYWTALKRAVFFRRRSP